MNELENTLARLRADLDRLALLGRDSRVATGPVTGEDDRLSSPFVDHAAHETRLATAVAWTRANLIGSQVLELESLHNPEWSMLLDLYVSYLRTQTPSVSTVCLAAGTPPTTALRHLAILVDQGRVIRISDQFDRRRTLLKLAGNTIAAMDRVMDDVIKSDRRYGLERMKVSRPNVSLW